MKYFKHSEKEKSLSVTMSPRMHENLLRGQKKSEDSPAIRGCETPEKLAEYVDRAWGLLGSVTEVLAQ